MSKNPKVEFYKIILHPTPSTSNDITFKDVYQKIYLNLKPEEENIESISNNDLKRNFNQHFFNSIDNKFQRDSRKRKAFYSKSIKIDGSITNPIKFSLASSTISGLIKGGDYDTGKDLGDIGKPEDDTEPLDESNILLDNFYFSLYTPLNKNIAILAIHSYTKDQIADVFTPFISKLFRIPGFTYNAMLESFMPKEMQENFKKTSIVKQLNYSNRVIVNDIEDGVIMNEEFSIKIEINSLGEQINLKNLPLWKKKIGESILGLPNRPEKSLGSFNKQTGYLKSKGGVTTPASFQLDKNDIDIKPTIFLKNYIRVEENGIPDWPQLESFINKTLEEIVKPEVYPEDNLNED